MSAVKASAWHLANHQLATAWARLSNRDRRLVSLMLTVLLMALLWWALIAPAVRMWRQAPAAHAAWDAQLQTLQSQAQQAQALQGKPALPADQAKAQVLQNTTQLFGPQTTAQAMGDEVVVTVQQTSSAQLAQGLFTLRSNAHAVVAQAQLQAVAAAPSTPQPTETTSSATTTPPTSAADARLWSGTVRLRLPPAN